MSAKNHDRSPDKKNFSIALPIVLINQLQRIADKETRSRNKQIEHFLLESVKLWEKSKATAAPQTIAPLSVLPDAKLSPSSPATGAPVAKRSRARTRNQQKKSS